MKRLLFLIFFVFLFVINCVLADDIELDFKVICKEINKKQVAFLDSQKDASSSKKWSTAAEKWRVRLDRLIAKQPDSIWADDAQYLKARLSNQNLNIWATEHQRLFDRYPDCSLEQWTKDTVLFLTPQHIPANLEILAELIGTYKKLGNQKKAEELYVYAVNKYPKYKPIFDLNYDVTNLSAEQLDIAEEASGRLNEFEKQNEEKARSNIKKVK